MDTNRSKPARGLSHDSTRAANSGKTSPYGIDHVALFENKISKVTAPETEEKWLTSQEAADYLGISVASLMNETSNGLIPYYKLGRRNRYLRSELKSLLLANKRGGLR